ncbi:MAG: flagellar filament capping protein FliD [Rhodospirillales bacterium]|nr:flagellar filament capping protein FliD [Rhodospirillales bacterium]
MLSNNSIYSALSSSYSAKYAAGYSSSGPSDRITLASAQLARQITADTVQISGYGKLQAAVAVFQATAKGFATTDSVSSVQATSSDATVASASAVSTASTGTYNLIIGQVAQVEATVSGAFADPDAASVGSGTLSIQLGEYVSGTNTFTPGASPPTAINITGGSLNSIASAINGANAGVTASVVQDGAGYHLALSSTSTGVANGFSLSVTDIDGNNTDMTGLSQLAFDPTAAIGAGKNLTQTQAAQDAAYTVNGIAGTSATNSNITIGPGLTVNLLTAGSTTVSVTESATALTAAAQGLVDGYNTLVTAIKDLTAIGGDLAGDPLSARLLSALQQEPSTKHAGAATLNYLYQAGITANTSGALALDSATLTAAFNSDAAGVKALVNNVANSFDALVDPYLNSGGAISSVTRVVQRDLTYQETREVGLDAMSLLSSGAASTYGATLNQSLYDAWSSGSGFSLFA